MRHAFFYHFAIGSQLLRLQRFIKMNIEIDSLFLEQMGKQYLCIQARRFHAFLLKVLLGPLEYPANRPYFVICHILFHLFQPFCLICRDKCV